MDYMAVANAARATIQMDHSAGGPYLSAEEASKFERETSENLLKQRKLTLVVDLDQTILHTTMDRTVGEWLADKSRAIEAGTLEEEEIKNPNLSALDDVASFQLIDDLRAMGIYRADAPFYYVKPR